MNGYFALLRPECILIVGALVVLMIGLSRSLAAQRFTPWAAVLTTAIALAVVVVWQPVPDHAQLLPGIEVGTLAWFVRIVALAVGLIVLLVNMGTPAPEENGEYFSMVLFSLSGILLTTVADDIVLLFLAIELVSVPTYALVAAGSLDVRAQESGVKYFFLGAMAAALLAYGLSFVYGATGVTQLSAMRGTLDLADPYVLLGVVLVIGGLAYKIAAVPMHVYAADVYQGAASPITGLLGFFPKIAGFVALIKVLAMVAPSVAAGVRTAAWLPPDLLFWMLWALAAATMTVGNCLALFQSNVKRMLAYSSIAHSGYMLVAVLVGSTDIGGQMHDGWSAMLFYITAYGVMNLGAFAVLAYVRIKGGATEELDHLAGLGRVQPVPALVLAVCVFSLMGMPPTVGFFGKFYIFTGALSVDLSHPHHVAMITLAVIGLLNSAIAAAYYLRIVGACYLREPRETPTLGPHWPVRFGLVLCSVFVVAVGLWPRELFRIAGNATADLQLPVPTKTFFVEPPNDQDALPDAAASAKNQQPEPPLVAPRGV